MNSVSKTGQTDVLIVGAGPVGLTLANELTRHGVRHRLIDRSPCASDKSKALGVMARTLELLEKTGAAEMFVAEGQPICGFNVFSEGKKLLHVDLHEFIQSPYPYVLMLPQNRTEAILINHLLKSGGRVEREVELLRFSHDANGVESTVRHSDGGEEHIRTEWLIGCDGAHSTVRHGLGIDFVGSALEQAFALADVHVEWSLSNDEVYVFLHKGNILAFFPMESGTRHRIILAEHEAETSGDVTLNQVQNFINLCGPQGTRISDPRWLTRFHINQRKVERYTHGRLILAGDAAHIHSPIGGQGMNTGMQDAFNLAWKLALVVKQKASENLMDSYEAEREPVLHTLLQATERATRIALLDGSVPVRLRDHLAPLILSTQVARQRLADALSETAIAYRKSPIVHDSRRRKIYRKKHLSAGERAPDGRLLSFGGGEHRLFELFQSTRHVMLGFSGGNSSTTGYDTWTNLCALVSEQFPDMLDAYWLEGGKESISSSQLSNIYRDCDGILHQTYACSDGGLVLIRPDGYIGLHTAAMSSDGVIRYFEQLLNK